mgnify:CR=1 FL=1
MTRMCIALLSGQLQEAVQYNPVLFFMLPFFARTLTRREMALGCAVLSLALLLSTLPAALRWGQAQLDTGTLLCADTLRFHIRADSDSPADQTAKLAMPFWPTPMPTAPHRTSLPPCAGRQRTCPHWS